MLQFYKASLQFYKKEKIARFDEETGDFAISDYRQIQLVSFL